METCEKCQTQMDYEFGKRRSLTWTCPNCGWKIFDCAEKQYKPNHCDDCGKPLDPPLSDENLQEQWNQRNNKYYAFCCDECIASGHTLAMFEEDGTMKVFDEDIEIHRQRSLGPGKKAERLH
jgi:predicted RNA-binding Zn-ribbon protein involved in translation (DUF1610 family)